ncbi:MAG TPA: glycoside hydrolase family 15 protein [Acidimicrobiia bacterium]
MTSLLHTDTDAAPEGDGAARAAYPPIENHGIIGDLQTTALVASDGTIDWFCAPRCDSPSVFASLLDSRRGGHCYVRPEDARYVARQLYLPGTSILVTRFMHADGVGELIDFMPVITGGPSGTHTIIRALRVVRGRMRFAMECQPRFDYGRAPHDVEVADHHARFRGGDGSHLALQLVHRDGEQPACSELERHGDGVHARFDVAVGDITAIVLRYDRDGAPLHCTADEVLECFEATREFWREWIGRSEYTGRWREAVERSAMTLKLLTYHPTGAPIAAATAGLPEQIGGERNWDYRYTWIRDGSFSVFALLALGYTDEAGAFLHWLAARLDDGARRDPSEPPLDIMYRVDGSSDLDEQVLDHFEGWRQSSPVRVGNGASKQLQLDIFGEALDSVFAGTCRGLPVTHQGWSGVRRVVGWLCDNWDRVEEGIWETRGGRQDYTYGRLMSWVAFDRSVRLAVEHSRPADVARWTTARDAVYEQIIRRGWNPSRQAFVQHYGTDVLDASLLYMPLVGFLAPRDPMWQSTLRAMDDELVSDSLVYRYDPAASPDGLRGSEGTFSICTYWYVRALARSGRLDDARLTFEKMLTYANHVGLYGEEIGPTGEQLGNFPQAFTHLALINAAIDLDQELGHPA